MGAIDKGSGPIAARKNVFATSLAPLREPLFRSLWFAAVISYTGTWMQNLGAGWLMASLTDSPLMVALVQAAISLPVFLIILPAGALADLVDRRRLLLVTQSWMALTAVALAVLTYTGNVTPWLLLLLTLLLGFGLVMNDPAWQAITPDIVSRRNLTSAVALNSAGFNMARAIGPALGGLVIALAGTWLVFGLNALSFLGVIALLYLWKNSSNAVPSTQRRVLAAVSDGLRHARQSTAVHAVLVRTGVFSFAASALLALLPLIARPHGSIGYGLMLGAFGVGASVGAASGPWFRHYVHVDVLAAVATVVFASAVAAVGWWQHSFLLLLGFMFAAGLGWIQILTALNVSAQTASPSWVRARTLSMYLLVLQGGIAGGSTLWGALAASYGIPQALLWAAAALVLGLVVVPRFRLHDIEQAWRSRESAVTVDQT
jgi:predicted MFS family arabinose efflux permease